MDFDLVVRGGTLLDGSGRVGVRSDLDVRGGTIVALGEARGDARQVSTPVGWRWRRASSTCGAVYLFCSPDSDFVSGQTLLVTGGA